MYILKVMDIMDIASKVEAILFFKNEPVSRKKLATWLDIEEYELDEGVKTLEDNLDKRGGLKLIQKDGFLALGTDPEAGELIEGLVKDDLNKDLGRAGLETLAIVLYWGPVSRSEIDYIRGVNSSFIVRNLMVRGLIERVVDPKNSRSFLYRPTFELLGHLGLKSVTDLPDYDKVVENLKAFKENDVTHEDKQNNQ